VPLDRWAYDDPNPIAKESIRRADQDAAIALLEARGISLQAAPFDYPEVSPTCLNPVYIDQWPLRTGSVPYQSRISTARTRATGPRSTRHRPPSTTRRYWSIAAIDAQLLYAAPSHLV
jgi:hypothetical protein